MGADFNIKQGDGLPSFERTLSFAGTLSGASVLFFLTKKGDTVPTVAGTAVIVDAALRKVRYDWDTNDTLVSGEYDGEFEVTHAGGQVQTFPADRYYDISIRRNLDVAEAAPPFPGTAGGIVSMRPIDGVTNDTPRLIEALQATAYKKAVMMLPGLNGEAWQLKSSPLATGLYLPNGCTIIGTSGTSVVQTITPTGSALETCFAATFTVSGNVSTLTTGAVKGSRTIVVTGTPGFAIGDYILVSELLVTGIRAAIYKVRNLTGVGPYTITVDRPILFNFVTSDTVQKCTPAKDIRIIGNGMRVSGAGARLVELYGAINCEVSDLIGDASGCTERALSIDVGSYNCHVKRCHFDNGAGSCPIGSSFESTEACSMEDCVAIGFTQNGHFMQDAQMSSFDRCWSYVCGSGFSVSTGAGGVLGSNDNTVTDCFASGCSSTGFVLANGSSRNAFAGCVASYNPQGFSLQAGTTLASNSFCGCKATGNTVAGILVGANSVGTLVDSFSAEDNSVGVRVDVGARGSRFINLAVYRSTSTGCTLSDEAAFTGGAIVDCPIGVAVTGLPAAAVVRFRDLEITSTASGWSGVQVANSSAGRVIIDGCRITTTGTGSIAVQHLVASVVVVSDTEGSGGAGSYGYAGVSGSTLRRSGRVDFSGYPTAFLIDGAGYSNIGTLTLNGASAVNYNFTDIKATDPVRLTRKTAGGTAGPSPTFVITAGTKVAVTGTAADTSVYEIQIG